MGILLLGFLDEGVFGTDFTDYTVGLGGVGGRRAVDAGSLLIPLLGWRLQRFTVILQTIGIKRRVTPFSHLSGSGE